MGNGMLTAIQIGQMWTGSSTTKDNYGFKLNRTSLILIKFIEKMLISMTSNMYALKIYSIAYLMILICYYKCHYFFV